MKKHLVFILMCTFIFILTACSSGESLSKEEVIAEVKQQIKYVENYHTIIDLGVVITDVESEQILESSVGTVSADVIESTLESSGQMTEPEGTTEHYSTDDAIYIKRNDEPWREGTEADLPVTDEFSLYNQIATIIVDLEGEEDVQMEENDDTYTFTFTGKSESIYEAFEDPYALKLTGTTPRELEQDMEIIIDKESFYLKQMKNSFTVEKEGAELVISVQQTYEKMNDIDEITIPEEVIDEAGKGVDLEDKIGNENSEDQRAKIDVIENVEERMIEVNSYYTDASLMIDIIDLATNETVDSSQAIEQIDVIENPFESSGIVVEDDVTQHYYSTIDATYVQFDDEPWEDYSDEGDLYVQTDLWYRDVAQILIDLKEEGDLRMEEHGGKFVFTFSGKSETVYTAFETPYSLSLTGAMPDELEQNMTITIDPDTYFINHVENLFVVEKDGQELSIHIMQSYEKMNEIDEIKIPQEVIDEVNEQ